MNMVNQLLLLSGNDIPFEEAQLIIHQPRLHEIAFIGEESLWYGAKMLNFSKNLLSDKDKINLSHKTDFEVLLSVIEDKDVQTQIKKAQVELVLTLLFPDYHVNFTPSAIVFQYKNEPQLQLIDNSNFEIFKHLIVSIFCLDQLGGKGTREYNPANAAAEALVQKFKQRRQKLAELKKDNGANGLNILSIYSSILAVGNYKDLNQIMQYTVFQLFDEFNRFKLKLEFDANMQARMAGAKDLKEAENWMKNLYAASDDD